MFDVVFKDTVFKVLCVCVSHRPNRRSEFVAADVDGDERLNIVEFTGFLFPGASVLACVHCV